MLKSSSYLTLPEIFYQKVSPTSITQPYVIHFNQPLASILGLNSKLTFEETAIYAGNTILPWPTLALAYAGHQFGHYVPLLGDGRALVLGEIYKQEENWDIQLKGSGKTKFSRNGDGRVPLEAVLRECLISEAMHGLGIPTTRCLVAIGSEDKIRRASDLVAQGVLTRIAKTHLRIGSFQWAAANGGVQPLADYAIKRWYPDLNSNKSPYLKWFYKIIDAQAYLIARWLGVGFIHGVMNTDNMNILGETLDYGPCAFLDEFDLQKVFSSIDYHGRYAYGNQPAIAQWNLLQLGKSLSPLLSKDSQQAESIINQSLEYFACQFNIHWYKLLHAKLGLIRENKALINKLLAIMHQKKLDFTYTFMLFRQACIDLKTKQRLSEYLGDALWVEQWFDLLEPPKSQDLMTKVNPLYIPRNYLIEKAINDYIQTKDKTLFNALLTVFQSPYHQHSNTEYLQKLPTSHQIVFQTFCGT